jgi:hypothetical protein
VGHLHPYAASAPIGAWSGCDALVRQGTTIVVRVGGTRLEKAELLEGLWRSLRAGFQGKRIGLLHNGSTTEIRNRQTNVFRPGTVAQRFEHDFAFEIA